jgi:hypothetical protein
LRAAHPPPEQLRASAPGAFRGSLRPGRREASELAALRARAAAEVAAEAAARDAPAEAARATCYAQTFKAPPMAGIRCAPWVGARAAGRGRPQPSRRPLLPRRPAHPALACPTCGPRSVGARVMRTRDGGPVARDPEFLIEAGIVPRATADRVFRRQRAFNGRDSTGAGACCPAGTAAEAALAAEAVDVAAPAPAAAPPAGGPRGGRPTAAPHGRAAGGPAAAPDQGDAPVTLYSYSYDPEGRPDSPRAAAAGAAGAAGSASAPRGKQAALTAAFYSTGGPKSAPMARNDQFTKLDSDFNKLPDGCA